MGEPRPPRARRAASCRSLEHLLQASALARPTSRVAAVGGRRSLSQRRELAAARWRSSPSLKRRGRAGPWPKPTEEAARAGRALARPDARATRAEPATCRARCPYTAEQMLDPALVAGARLLRESRRAGRGRGSGPGARLRALFRLRRRRRDPRRQRPESSPAATSRTPPIRRASAPRPTRSASWWRPASGRSPRSRWSAAARRCARPAAAAASAWPSSGARRPRSIWRRRTGSATTTTLGELLPMAFGPINLARRCRRSAEDAAAVIRRARRRPAAAGRARPGLGPRRHRRARRRAGRRSTIATCRAFRGRACRAMPAGWCWAASPACRSPACRAAPISTRASAPHRSTRWCARCKAIGCRALLLTNASGSLRPELGRGRWC